MNQVLAPLSLPRKIAGFVKHHILKFHRKTQFIFNFYKKFCLPTPSWMLEQIEQDLTPFQKELSLKFLDDFFAKDGLFLVRVKVIKGVITFQKSPSAARGFYNVFLDQKVVDISDRIIAHIRKLHRLMPLSDIDFVFTSCDHLPPYHRSSCLPPGNPSWPILVMSKCKCDPGLILMPDWYSFEGYEPHKSLVLRGNQLYPWDSKLDLLFFRGADSGAWDSSTWSQAPRPKLVNLSLQYPQLIDAKFPHLLAYDEDLESKLERAKKQGLIGNYVSMEEHPKYRYLMDIDGECASTPRFPLLLHSNSVILKNMTQSMLWFYRKTEPYKHFIPVQEDLSDLLIQLQWAKNHKEDCKKISENARLFAKTSLNPESAYFFLYKLLEAYSKKQREVYDLK